MKKHPIATILRSIQPLRRALKIARLREHIAVEPPRSIRRGELEAVLCDLMTKQIKCECRRAAA